MESAEECRRKSFELLRAATLAVDLNERSRLINQAVYWNEQALELKWAREDADRGAVIPFPTDPKA